MAILRKQFARFHQSRPNQCMFRRRLSRSRTLSGILLRRALLEKAPLAIASAGVRRSQDRRPPTAAAGRPYLEAVAGEKFDADFFRAQDPWRSAGRYQAIIVGNAVFPAKHSTRAVARAVSRGVSKCRLGRFQHQIKGDAEAAPKPSVAA